MTYLVSSLLLVLGLALLYFGGDRLVRGSLTLSKVLKLPPLVIGLTVVAFGTSAPELFVNIQAALQSRGELAMGNILGSNLANLLLVLGVSAILSKIHIEQKGFNRDFYANILFHLLLYIFIIFALFHDSQVLLLSRAEAVVLLLFFILYMTVTVVQEKRKYIEEAISEEVDPPAKGIIWFLIGVAGLALGGRLTVDHASALARLIGLSEAIIGLTIVAIGTSLPELVASVIAAKRGESELALGNVLGSNIFNLAFVLALSGLVKPIEISAQSLFDLMACLFALFWLILAYFLTRRMHIAQFYGIMAIIIYFAYMVVTIF